MSDKWEASINDWYENSPTANLSYLDLATEGHKVTNSELAHNLAVVYDRTCLSSRVHLKNFKSLCSQLIDLQKEVSALKEEVKKLRSAYRANRPLTAEEVKSLVEEIAKYPKEIETQAVKLTTELAEQVEETKKLIREARGF